MWVPPEDKDPVLLHAPTRASVALFGAVRPLTGELVTMFAPRFDAGRFEAFLDLVRRRRDRSRRSVLICDNASYHHARELGPFFERRRGTLRLDFLPPYSPELNPIERVWKLLRHCSLHNQYFPKLEDVIRAVSDPLSRWDRPNLILRKLCCIT